MLGRQPDQHPGNNPLDFLAQPANNQKERPFVSSVEVAGAPP
jgi:hypothetical protein